MMSSSADKNLEPPPHKKIKLSPEPDLKVSVGSRKETERVFYHHSILLASYSNYIDAILASQMKESESKEIRFPDIEPETWIKMISILEDPLKAYQMTVKDAMEVAEMYDKYGFERGLDLCTHIMLQYIENAKQVRSYNDIDLDVLVDMVLVAEAAHLKSARSAGFKFLRDKLMNGYTQIMFSVQHIEKLVPLIVKDTSLMEFIGESKETVLSPLFPRLYVLCNIQNQSMKCLLESIQAIRLSASKASVSQLFYEQDDGWDSKDTGTWGGKQLNFSLEHRSDGWVLSGWTEPQIGEDGEPDDNSIETLDLWHCPNSGNMPLPPQMGWKAVDALARGDLTVKYIYEGADFD